MKMQNGMASSTKTLMPNQRGVSRNRDTLPRYGAAPGHRGAGAVPFRQVVPARRGLVRLRPEVGDGGYTAALVTGEEGDGVHRVQTRREVSPRDDLARFGDDPLGPQMPVTRVLTVELDVPLPSADALTGLRQGVHDALGQRV